MAGKIMQITPVKDVLSNIGLNEPDLNVLAPNQENYTAHFLQPEGNIEVSRDGVRHVDRSLASRQFGTFLRDAVDMKADLVVTPEYSMPWETLEDNLSSGIVPVLGSVWVLGCESIALSELESFKERLAPTVSVILENIGGDTDRFLNAVAYVFLTQPFAVEDSPQLVMLLQFKNCPMGDPEHFETNAMQTGTRLYCFGYPDRRSNSTC